MILPYSYLYLFCIELLLLRYTKGSCSTTPPVIENGYVRFEDNDKNDEGVTIMYECAMGFRKDLNVGVGTATCNNGKWTVPQIKCLPLTCTPLDNPQHGRIIGTEVTFGSRVTFECDPGYDRHTEFNNMERICRDDGWDAEEFHCIPIECPPVNDIKRGKVSSYNRAFKTQIKFTCNPGYILRGTNMKECLSDKTWSHPDPKCVDSSCENPNSNEFRNAHPHLGETHVPIGISPGNSVTFICQEDADKTIISICAKDGLWDPNPPSSSFCKGLTTTIPPILVDSTTKSSTSGLKTTLDTNKNDATVNLVVTTLEPSTKNLFAITVKSTDWLGGENDKSEIDTTEPTKPSDSFPIWVIVSIIIALFAGALVAGLLVWRKNLSKRSSKEKLDAEMEALKPADESVTRFKISGPEKESLGAGNVERKPLDKGDASTARLEKFDGEMESIADNKAHL